MPLGDNSTRWHTNTTRSYIENSDQLEGWLKDGQFPEWALCMLDSDCPLQEIEYTSAANRTLKAEAEGRSGAAALADRGDGLHIFGQEKEVIADSRG